MQLLDEARNFNLDQQDNNAKQSTATVSTNLKSDETPPKTHSMNQTPVETPTVKNEIVMKENKPVCKSFIAEVIQKSKEIIQQCKDLKKTTESECLQQAKRTGMCTLGINDKGNY